MKLSHSRSSISARYDALVAQGVLQREPSQLAVIDKLEALLERISHPPAQNQGWMQRALSAIKRADTTPRGLYLWGGVGRGKTMMMDFFFDAAPIEKKRRAHFHSFMSDVHERLHRARKNAQNDGADPVSRVAQEIAAQTELLCFDEFAVTDIADATILARLFSTLFAAGVIVVATSNVEPARLYEGGRNRDLFLPFIALLQQRMDVLRLETPFDFRAQKDCTGDVYITPVGAEATAALDALFLALTGATHGAPATIEIKRRAIFLPQVVGRVARAPFVDLCGRALAAGDYLALAQKFDAVIFDDVPLMGIEQRNEARRLIMLIDVLYEARALLALSAAAEPLALYQAAHGAEAREFHRAASRLNEMRSQSYLENTVAGRALTASPCTP